MTNEDILQTAGIGVFIHGHFGQTLLTMILNAMKKAREDEHTRCAKICRAFGKTLEDDNGESYAEEIMARKGE